MQKIDVLCYEGVRLFHRLWHVMKSVRKTSRKLSNTLVENDKDPKHGTIRTTKMLLGISILCIVTQIPVAVLDALNTTFINKHYYDECTPKQHELYLILSSLNSSGTFFIYYFMSSKFRGTFKWIFALENLDSAYYNIKSKNRMKFGSI